MVCIFATYTGYQYINRSKTNKKGLIILTYHSISNEIEPDETVTPEEFERQLHYIKKNYKVISLEEAVGYLKTDFEKISGSIVITFDDGYSDNYHNAYPLLKKYNFPATIFLVSDFIENNGNKYLSLSQVNEMKNNNISFGSHTISHRILARLTNEEVVKEIKDSKDVLESKLSKKISSFAYPIGTRADFNDETMEIVKTCKYACACSNMYGMNGKNADIFALKRIGIETTDNFFIFKKKLNGALNILSFKDTKFFQKLKRIFF
ncbi:MAG: putative polysaccharide deacetylase [Candidatus Scalindua rubra]|uniref:Putative polysaccharide deacetylase n=1 Tax=Candidatus Scalindua rubra TaxID=1872076 RepID=A0A1E3XET1_9BACT|nr:MAG: putative polysaccharide deacetylase [Candidatus Scalindua rubra]